MELAKFSLDLNLVLLAFSVLEHVKLLQSLSLKDLVHALGTLSFQQPSRVPSSVHFVFMGLLKVCPVGFLIEGAAVCRSEAPFLGLDVLGEVNHLL